jgi:hypothetical protein
MNTTNKIELKPSNFNTIQMSNFSEKKERGQFYTTHQEYILTGIKIPPHIKNIIEPFAGDGDLINFIKKDNIPYNIECYDIDPKKEFIVQRDTIKDPPIYSNKYIITNPPYLARNKSTDKTLFDKYNTNDLYKCVIKEITINACLGGILIIPLNFWSSIRIADIELRKLFLEKYDIILLNIFEEQVFEDTTYTICSFQFDLKKIKNELIQNDSTTNEFNIMIYPSNTKITTTLNDNNNYMIGGDIYNLKLTNTYKITRLTKKNQDKSNTNIVVKCIDDNRNSKIGLSFVEDKDIYIDNTPNQTARTYATLIIEPKINQEKQKQLVLKFNEFLDKKREMFHSLFLTNYRESKDIARKRISFDLVYSITEYILDNFDSNDSNDL